MKARTTTGTTKYRVGGLAALFTALFVFLALAPTAHAGKIVDRIVAGTEAAGTAEGRFDDPTGLAFNDPAIPDNTTDPQGDSTDGYLYVADRDNNRIQVFDAAGDFKFTFGRGVLSGGDGLEVCDHTQTPCHAALPDDEAGELARPHKIAINQQTGDLYIHGGGSGSGNSNFRIDQFSAEGTFIRAWGWGVATGAAAFEICTVSCRAGISGENGGQFDDGAFGALAVDPVAPHHVFVAERRNNRISEFEADGSFVRAWGWDVVASGQAGDLGTDIFEVCASSAAGVCKRGAGVGTPADGRTPSPQAIVLDDGGTVYVAAVQGLQRFNSDAVTAAALPLPRLELSTSTLAIDPSSGNLLVGATPATGPTVRELDLSVEPPVQIDGHLIRHPLPAGISQTLFAPDSLAVDPASGDFYTTMSAGASGIGHRVFAADEDGATPPPAFTLADPSSTVSGPNATLTGTVTPGGPPGFNTTYNFQYRKLAAASWIDVPASDNPLGDGLAPVEVSDQISNLEPNSDYEVRLLARKAFGNPDAASAPISFTSAAIAPQAQSVSPAARWSTGALLTGIVNPNNSQTSFFFEWGTDTSYGNIAPIPAGDAGDDFGPRTVTARIEGLQPESTYHYRVVAENGVEVSPGEVEVKGADVSFATRATPAAAGERAYEMVTPPFKVVRSIGAASQLPRDNPNPGVPSLDGNSIVWGTTFLPLTDDVAAPLSADHRISRRGEGGWSDSTRNTLSPILTEEVANNPSWFLKVNPVAGSGDLETATWGATGGNEDAFFGLLPSEGALASRLYTRRDGTGTDGYTPWLENPEIQAAPYGKLTGSPGGNSHSSKDMALLNDAGTAMVRWGAYRGLADLPGNDAADPSDDQQLPGTSGSSVLRAFGGATIYRQLATDPDELPGAEKDLVNECTGSGAGATKLPSRVGGGSSATDTIGTRNCAAGNVTSVRGAAVGAADDPHNSFASAGPLSGTAATAASDDGRRVFFTSPDMAAADVPLSACANGAGAATNCPPQLFVRQYDSDGDPVVRWISRSRSVAAPGGGYEGAMIAGQQIGQLGSGASFQGASKDGRVVYFKTNAPLTPDDPNGGVSITTGSAQNTSWDLYRYELPTDLDADPDGGVLTRISGGPGGTADPGTNQSSNSGQTTSGSGGALRYLSDDGRRAYFLTSSPIAGADATPPVGGATTPGGAVGNTTTRNLYLFDDTESGADRYKFIARIPFAAPVATAPGESNLDACASFGFHLGQHLSEAGTTCFRGTPSGEGTIFATRGQLSGDDVDPSLDIYLYDARGDELVRVSAPPSGAQPYQCKGAATCNADLGRGGSIFFSLGDWQSIRGWGGMRYYNISEDQSGAISVYFESKSELIPADTNGDHMDVYEWREGELTLVSPGDSPHDSWYSGSSVDGASVFMVTSARIDPREIDPDDLDIYAARVGGGFPYTPPPTPCDVLTFACESEASRPPGVSAPATGFVGPSGNVAPPAVSRRCGKGKLKRKGRCVSKRAIAKKRKAAARKRRAAKKRKAAMRKKRAARRAQLQRRAVR